MKWKQSISHFIICSEGRHEWLMKWKHSNLQPVCYSHLDRQLTIHFLRVMCWDGERKNQTNRQTENRNRKKKSKIKREGVKTKRQKERKKERRKKEGKKEKG